MVVPGRSGRREGTEAPDLKNGATKITKETEGKEATFPLISAPVAGALRARAGPKGPAPPLMMVPVDRNSV
jgi:hypothetical protein